eukprot:COSAG01_NODE_84_length_27672_cov_60.966344_17_plen_43_part_00
MQKSDLDFVHDSFARHDTCNALQVGVKKLFASAAKRHKSAPM